MKLLTTILPIVFILCGLTAFSQGTIRYQNSIRGGLAVASNSMRLNSGTYLNSASAAGVTRSSSSDLILPAGSTIVKAILYAEGYTSSRITSVKFRVPGGTYTTLTTASAGFIANPLSGGSAYTQFIIDVTAMMPATGFVSAAVAGGEATGIGRYSVADIEPFNSGNYGYGWTLMVVYSNATARYRNVTIADACQNYSYGQQITTIIPNITVPATGVVNAMMAATGCYGDSGLPDDLRLGVTGVGTGTAVVDPIGNTSTDVLNGTIGIRTPLNVTIDGATGLATGNFTARAPYNGFGGTGASSYFFDCDVIDASNILTPSPTPISVTVYQRSTGNIINGDVLGAGAFGLSIDIAPAVLQKAISPATIPCGGTATYTFTISNTQPGNYNQTGLGFTDNLPSGLRIASPNGVVITGGTGGVVTAVPGTGVFSLTGFNLAGGQTATITLNVTNVAGQYNASCGGNPAAFTNGPTNITGNTLDLANAVTPQCLIVTAPVTPTFAAIGPLCQGSAAPALPTTSTNTPAITGTWSPATINTATAGTFTFTFTPAAGQCANTTTLTVTINPTTVPNFAPVGPYCAGAAIPALPTTSINGVTGTWSPAIDNTTTTTYTFTPSGGTCPTTAQLTITITPNVTPTFNPVGPYCSGATIPALTTISNEGVSGTWAPAAVSNTASGTYTFTPSSGTCVNTASLSVTITPNVTPTFSAVGPFCQGDAITALPTSSNNGYTGSWAPAINNTATTTYTFTPTAGLCATTAQLTITINNPVTPTFTAVGPFCEGDAIAALPTTSNNGYTGSWAPAINNTATTTYTFTPTAGQCATTAQMTITITPPTVPTFTAVGPFCEGDAIAALPTTSNNSITGTWAPAINNMATTTYTFTPAAGVCATTAQMTITINPPVVPTFTAVGPFCEGDVIAALPTTSNNSITGTWAPAINNMATTTYTFTPTAGVCATTAQMTITINPPTTPTFPPVAPLCVGDPAPSLPATSNEGNTGTWTPATISTTTAGTFTFTFNPTAGTCVTTATITVTIGPPAAPVFTPEGPFCSGDAIAPLPTTSNNGVTGTWAPAINNTATTTYTFSPTAGVCATTTNMVITINPPTTPTFTAVGPYCVGETIPALPTTSDNAITGSWAPAINNTATTAYTFTPDPGQCATTATLTIVVNPSIMPTFTPPSPFCEGGTAPTLPGTSNNSITGSWAPGMVSNTASGTYTFTPDPGQCASSMTQSITVNPNPTISVPDVTTCANTDIVLNASGGVSYTWSPGTGLSATTGASVTANLPGPGPYTVTIDGVDANGCAGTTTAQIAIAASLTISVNPPSANLCAGGSVVLTASGGVNYTWSPPAGLWATTGATVTASPAASTTYTVLGESSGCTGQATVVVNVGTQVTPTFDPITALCSGSAAPVLQSPSNEGINGTWAPAVVSNTASGTYTFTPAAGECATTASLSVTVNPVPTVTSIDETCDGTNTSYVVTVTISGGTAPFNLVENAPGGIGGSFSGSTWTSNPIPSGTAYDFDFFDASGCGPAKAAGSKNCNCATDVGTMSATLISLCGTASASPAYNSAGEVQDANDTQSFILHTSAGGTPGTVIQSNTSGTFTFAPPMVYGTTYYISAVVGDDDGSGLVDLNDPCLAMATGTPVVWYQAPTATPTSNSPLCEGATLNLTGNAVTGGTYQWTGPAAFSSTQQSPSVLNVTTANAGTYTLVITANGCPSLPATTDVVINAPTLPTFNPIAAVCQGAAAPALVSPSTNAIPGTWAPSFVNTASAGTQTFTFTPNAGQCATSTTISVTINALPVPSANSVSTCANTPINLCASGGTSYVWSPATGLDNANIACPTATLASNQTYNITVSDPNGCSATTTATVTMAPGLTISINPASATICAGQSVGLTASGANTYSWSPASGIDLPNSASVNASPAGTQVYTVTGDNNGCTGTATITVTVNPVPLMNAIADIAQCEGTTVGTVTFGSTPAGSSFTWTNTNTAIGMAASGTSSAISSFTGNTGTGTITVTPSLNGCTGTPETFDIVINANPVPTAGSNSPVCDGATLNLTSNGPAGSGFSWSGPQTFTSNNQNPSIGSVAVNQAGNYIVTVVDVNGCTGMATTNVIVNALPVPVISAAGPYCIDDNAAHPLSATPGGGTFSGSGVSAGAFTASNSAAGPVTITYDVIDGNGCSGQATSVITVNPLPTVVIDADPRVGCAPLEVNFTGDQGMSSSVWTFGDGASATDLGTGTVTHTYTSPGTYDVTLTNTLNGCSNTATVADFITVAPDPVADFSVRELELSVVDPTVYVTNGSTGAATYSWTFGDGEGTSTAVDPTYTYQSTPATYTIDLIATSVEGCTDEASLTIIVKDQLIFWVPNTFTPDGDAHNNTFQPVFTSGYDPYNFTMFIFNRWGEVVFETHDVTIGWDGTYAGKIAQEGTYTWTMEIKDPQSDKVSRHEGHVNIMR